MNDQQPANADALTGIRIVEQSILARLARRALNSRNVAMVLGRSIHLSGVSKQQFLANHQWVTHELVHVEQFRRYGLLRFLLLYAIETARHGYHDNAFEVEARRRAAQVTQGAPARTRNVP